jgi:hypothetical protein
VSEDFVFATIAANSGLADSIFMHGLTGDPVATWTSAGSGEPEGDFWPRWLSKDIPGLNLYTLGYSASIFARWARKEMALHEQAIATLDLLAAYDIGSRPIIIIAHSLGGVLAKQLIRFGSEAASPAFKAISNNCRLVVFIATPHTGSSLASILEFFVPHLISNSIALLQSGGSQLDDLNQAYRNIASEKGIRTVTYYETHKTKKVAFVVERRDADPGIGEVPVPVPANHLDICKPINRHQQVYVSICRHLRDFLKPLHAGAIPSSTKSESDHEVVQLLQKRFIQGWLAERFALQASNLTERVESGVFDEMGSARKKALAGTWKGVEKQSYGPDGEPIEYPVMLDINWHGNVAKGSFHFIWKQNGVVVVDERLPFEGGFFDRFLVLSFQDTISGKIQFGSLFLELNDDNTILHGVEVGVGYKTKKIATGDVVLKRA